MGKTKVNLRDFISGVVFAIFGAYVVFGKNVVRGKVFGIDRMPLVSRADFYIHALGWVLLVLSLGLIVRAVVKKEETEKKEVPIVAVYSGISLVIFCLIVKPLTFYPSAVLLIAFWVFIFRIKEYHIAKTDRKGILKSLLISIVYSAVVVLILQLVFTRLLGVRLP